MRKSFVFCTLLFLLIFSSVNFAQEPSPELPIILELDSDITIRDVDWNFDSALVAFADGNESVKFINVNEDANENEIIAGQRIAWNSIRNHILVAINSVRIWDYSENTFLDAFEFPITEDYTPVGNFDWHPAEDKFAVVLRECDEGTPYRPGARVEIWNVEMSTFTQIAGCVSRGFGEVKWNPQGTQLAINGFSVFDDDGFEDFEEIEIWDVDTAEKLITITDLQDPWGLAWSPTGDIIAFTTIIGLDRFIQVWDVANDELVWQVEANLSTLVPLDWHPSENLIATGGQDGSVRIWDALSGKELIELSVHDEVVNDVSWSPDGTKLASAGSDGKLFVWDVSRLVRSLLPSKLGSPQRFGVNPFVDQG